MALLKLYVVSKIEIWDNKLKNFNSKPSKFVIENFAGFVQVKEFWKVK